MSLRRSVAGGDCLIPALLGEQPGWFRLRADADFGRSGSLVAVLTFPLVLHLFSATRPVYGSPSGLFLGLILLRHRETSRACGTARAEAVTKARSPAAGCSLRWLARFFGAGAVAVAAERALPGELGLRAVVLADWAGW